jgi:hypothetical protein
VFIKLREKLKPLMVDKTARWLLLPSAFLNLAAWVLLLVRFVPSIRRGLAVALHYNVYLNVNSVGPAYLALLPAAIGLLILSLNASFAIRLYGTRRQNSLILLTTTLFYEILLLAASIFIVIVNLAR